MANALAFIGGGLLEGAGKGIIDQGKERRATALARGAEKREDALAKLKHTRALELEGVKEKNRRGLLDDTNKAALSRVEIQIEGRENTAKLDRESRENLASKNPRGRNTAAEEETIIGRHTKVNDNGFEVIDRKNAAIELDLRGLKLAAAEQRRLAAREANEEYQKQAEELVDAEIEAMAGTFRSDAEDFKEDSGSREKRRARRIPEVVAELKAADEASEAGDSGKVIDIVGTPAEQRQQLEQLPIGAKLRKDGIVYVKRAGGYEKVGEP